MAKKILGDDPFRAARSDEDKAAPRPAKATKSKRAPSKKTEAPRAALKKSAPQRKAKRPSETETVKVTVPVTVSATAETVTVSAADASTDAVTASASMPLAEPSSAPVAQATALTPRPTAEPPVEAAPGSWRWWRFRQQQLARAEEAAWLASPEQGRDRFGRDAALAGRAEPVVDVVYRTLLRVSVRGLGHVPESGRAILVARRRRATFGGLAGAALARLGKLRLPLSLTTPLDAALIGHAIRIEHVAHREVRPLVRPARLYTPILGGLLRRLGGVPADVHDLARLLDDERLALAFVDDVRRFDGTLDLKTIVCLALVTGAPIVPVVIAGGVPGRLLGGDGVTAIAFGEPLYHGAEFGPEGAEDDGLVERLTDDLSKELRAQS